MLKWFRSKYGAKSGHQEESKATLNPPRLHPVAAPPQPEPEMWAVGGGKGGVGKSFVASSLGVLLAGTGKSTLMVDADFGSANLHTFFGVQNSKATLSNFLKGEAADLGQVIVPTNVANLHLAGGAKDSLDVADIGEKGVETLRAGLRRARYDHLVLDIGPGTSSCQLDLFLLARKGIVVTTAEPTSVENSYRFLKCLFLRRIKNAINSPGNSALKEALHRVFQNNWGQRVKSISDILQALKRIDPNNGELLKELMEGLSIGIIINQTGAKTRPDFGASMERACREYFGVDITHLGDICSDEKVAESINHKKPLLAHYPETIAARKLRACFTKLTNEAGQAARSSVVAI